MKPTFDGQHVGDTCITEDGSLYEWTGSHWQLTTWEKWKQNEQERKDQHES